jgi:tRNA-splicing ligase RtcB
MSQFTLKRISEHIWEIPREGGMLVPARVFASESLLEKIQQDATLTQLRNAAHLPGIHKYAIALPDAHQGYGFPVGGVAALDAEHGVISPGAIGYDVNCGVRLCKTNLEYNSIKGKEQLLVDTLFSQIPTGIGKGSIVGTLSVKELDEVARLGVKWAFQKGLGVEGDLAHCEDEGFRPGADPSCVSEEAKARGRQQLGSLGSGNHFLEVQRVAEVFDEEIARQYGLFIDQIVIMIHCGSRGYGHQICTDYLRRVEQEHRDLLATLPDRELACAPVKSAAAQDYYKAMNCAINFAWCNRQLIMHRTRECFAQVLRTSWQKLGMDLLYDVAHNIGKKEVHRVNGKEREVYVHRKGATRAFPKGRIELPRVYREVGQPVIIPGSMGTGSYVLRGTQTALDLTFGSTAHGAGRVLSRTKASRQWRADEITRQLQERGIFVRGQSKATIAEEAPGAYKDLDEVVRVSHEVGIGTKVAKMVPVCNIKG